MDKEEDDLEGKIADKYTDKETRHRTLPHPPLPSFRPPLINLLAAWAHPYLIFLTLDLRR
jgi:hypothetical protein